ncbi:MAG: hypothetical protein AB7V10_07945 [Leucobacter sp.]
MSERLYIAAATVVKVSVGPATGHRIAQIVRRGDVLPQGVDQELLDKLEKRGLITLVETEDEAVEIPEGDPTADWKRDQLEAYAAAKGIDVSKAKNKPEVLEALAAAAGTGQ